MNKSFLPISIARVAGLEFEKIDALGLENAADFERIFSDETFFQTEIEREQTLVQQLSGDLVFQKSILFSSRDLFENLEKMRSKSVGDWVKKERQTALGAFEFLVRMASKTSPFAGFTTLQLVDTERVTSKTKADDLPDFFKNERWADAPFFENSLAEKTRATPNALFCAALFEAFLEDQKFRNQLSVSINPSIKKVEKTGYRFVHFDGENEAIQSLVASVVIDFLVDFMIEKGRVCAFSDLEKTLVEATDDEKSNVQTFLNQLISCGFLVFEMPVSSRDPKWATQLYQRLAFFEKFDAQQPALAVLNFLNGTAKQLAFLTTEQLLEVQNEAVLRWKTTFPNSDFEPKTEAVWFCDSASAVDFDFKNGEIEALIERLRVAAKAEKPTVLLENRRLLAFFIENWSETGEVDFLDFAQKRLETPAEDFEKLVAENDLLEPFSTQVSANFEGRKMAAAIMPFRRKTGQVDAVVNRTWSAGGRAFARFLSLFGEKNIDKIKVWNQPKSTAEIVVGFHGQHVSSANCAPVLTDFELDFAGSQPRLPISKRVGLGDFLIKIDSETGLLSLFFKKTDQRVRLLDLSLESADDRSAVLSLLFRVAAGVFLVPKMELQKRQKWIFEADDLPQKERETESSFSWLPRFLAFQKKENLPRFCFFEIKKESRSKPQLLDFQSVMSIQLFEKRLREAKTQVVLTEMLPLADGFIFEKRAAEIIVEFEI